MTATRYSTVYVGPIVPTQLMFGHATDDKTSTTTTTPLTNCDTIMIEKKM